MSYEAYQDILLYRWNTQLIWLGSKADNGLQSLYFARPTPRVVWLPGKPRQKYFKRLYARLYGTIKLSSDKYTFSTLTYHTEKWSRESAAQFLPDHLKEFWEPRMLDFLATHVKNGGDGLSPLALEGSKRVLG
jgi:hypothetical protein